MSRRDVILLLAAIAALFVLGPYIGISTILKQRFAQYIAGAFVIVGLYFLTSRKTRGQRREYEPIERNLAA
jgi:hypothetical protein